ncbi:MAG: zonular occludens toxin domain-containing protein [Phycisphaerales bacterium]
MRTSASGGGEELAKLIHPLKEEHWRKFLRRQHELAKFREHYSGRKPADLEEKELAQLVQATGRKREWLLEQPMLRYSHIFDWFRLHFGLETYEGHNADSIYPGSLIVLDEVQHWHPMLRQGTDPAREQLQAYLTMCRHHMHWLWVITQDRSRIDIIFRNLAQSIWRVWDRGEDKLAWGIRIKHLGIRAMGYQRFTRDQIEGRNKEDVNPSESFTILPQLPTNKVYFRLYSSVTNVGSKRDVERAINKAREAAGIRTDGVTEQELQRKQEQEQMSSAKKPLHKRIISKLVTGIILIIVGSSAFAIGQATQPEPQLVETATDEETQEIKPHNWPHFSGITSSGPMFDGQRVEIGATVGDRGQLRYFNFKKRSCVLIADGGYWLWQFGDTIPSLVGPVDQIRSAYERMEQADARGETVGDEAPDALGTVGP